MIQRIQSLYLSFVILLSILFCYGTVFSFNNDAGNSLKLILTGVLNEEGGQYFARAGFTWILPATLVLIILLSIVAILMFRNRRIQMLLAISLIVLSVILIATLSFYIFYAVSYYKLTIVPELKMAIPVMILLFSLLAYKGIRKDDSLIKSYDRLR